MAKTTKGGLMWIFIPVIVLVIIAGAILFSNKGDNSSGGDFSFDDHAKGDKDASVVLVEYADFQCPACGAYYPLVSDLRDSFSDSQLRIVFRHFPLSQIHPNAVSASRAAEAAGLQGKFFEMHDIIFENQSKWSSVPRPQSLFESYAGEIGLDVDQYKKDFSGSAVRLAVEQQAASANKFGLNSTPSFLLNGVKIDNPRSLDEFVAVVQAKLDQVPAPISSDQGESVHEHADFAVFLNGKKFDFAGEKYQSNEGDPFHDYMHLHDSVGGIVHKHQTGVSLGEFFDSVGVRLDDKCFVDDKGKEFCTDLNKGMTLKFFVNGEENLDFEDYEFSDLDRILISYGPIVDPAVEGQIASLGDDACIYSETCPERGKPPTESCVGGLGTDCVDNDNHDE